MIDENGKLTNIDIDEAREKVLEAARLANIEVADGSVEQMISEWLSKVFLDIDNSVYLSIQKFLYPTENDIDIQNPGIVRLAASKSNGYLEVDNTLGVDPITIPIDSIFVGSNFLEYSNTLEALVVVAGEIGYVYVESLLEGANTNLPQNQPFTLSNYEITNPQPISGGRDIETDSDYWNRIIYLRTNLASEQTSIVITNALLEFYLDAKVFVNNTNASQLTPIPIPANGYNCAVILPSGVNAPARELQKAIETLVAFAEFVGVNNVSTANHPVIYGISFSGVFPVAYSITPVQAVQTTLSLTVKVRFDSSIIEVEKPNLAKQFANNFVNRLMATFYSNDGSYNFEFIPLVGDDTIESIAVVGVVKDRDNIAPIVSIEAIRSIIYDQSDSVTIKGLQYRECVSLTVEFDPLVVGESPKILSIDAPFEDTILSIDFAKDALFLDESSWFDRWINLDPSLITVYVVEE